MLDVVFRQQALEDLEGIASYVGDRDAAAARRIIQRIHAVIFKTISRFPEAGKRDEKTATRQFPVRGLPYVVIYIAQANFIDIIAIYHTAQNPSKKPGP